MKIQIEQLDLLQPWPQFVLRDGYRAIRLLVRVGRIPVGEIAMRPMRRRVVAHDRLRRRIAKQYWQTLLKLLAEQGLAAGPTALRWFMPQAWPDIEMTTASPAAIRDYVEQRFLLPSGLPSPLCEWAVQAQRAAAAGPTPPVTVAICTRDRQATLSQCIENLRQLDYPNFDILIVDNSSDFVPTREIAERLGVNYVRCNSPGVTRARNVALAAAGGEWIAFTDDDCRPESNWLKELVRGTQDANCRCVCGMVLPARLENSAEVVLDTGVRRSFAARTFDSRSLRDVPSIGGGANMLLHRSFAQSIGGFDIDLGAGPRSIGGGEDADLFYRILRAGHTIHYAPRAIVHHHRVVAPKSLRKIVYGRAAGHAAFHAKCFAGFCDPRALAHLLWQMPRTLINQLASALRGRSRYPFPLILLQAKATIAGVVQYSWKKLARRLRLRGSTSVRVATPYTSVTTIAIEPASINPKLAA